jgi:hypothetical protein
MGVTPMHIRQRTSNSIHDYCKMYLSYLIDDGFIIKVSSVSVIPMTNDIHRINLSKGSVYFNWNQIKDSLIPLLLMLKQDYILDDKITFLGISRINSASTIINHGFTTVSYPLEQLIDDEFDITIIPKNVEILIGLK